MTQLLISSSLCPSPCITASESPQPKRNETPVSEVCTDKCDPLPMPVNTAPVVVEEAPLEWGIFICVM